MKKIIFFLTILCCSKIIWCAPINEEYPYGKKASEGDLYEASYLVTNTFKKNDPVVVINKQGAMVYGFIKRKAKGSFYEVCLQPKTSPNQECLYVAAQNIGKLLPMAKHVPKETVAVPTFSENNTFEDGEIVSVKTTVDGKTAYRLATIFCRKKQGTYKVEINESDPLIRMEAKNIGKLQ